MLSNDAMQIVWHHFTSKQGIGHISNIVRSFILLSLFIILFPSKSIGQSCSSLFAEQGSKYSQFRFNHLKYLHALNGIKKYNSSHSPAVTFKQHSELRVIASKILKNPYVELTNAELEKLVSNRLYYHTLTSSLYLAQFNELNFKVFKNLIHFIKARESKFQIYKEDKLYTVLRSSAKSLYNGPLRFFNPFFILPRIHSQTDTVFVKQWNNADYKPSELELAVLSKYNAEKEFHTKEKFMKTHPYWTKFRKLLGGLAVTFTLINSVAGINHGLHMQEGGVISYKDYGNNPSYKLKTHQVRLINENVPFPHLALQIGNKIYSYGQTHMKVSYTFEYFEAKSINQARLQYYKNNKIELPEPEPNTSFENSVVTVTEPIANALQIQKWPRSVEAVTLNLTVSEVARLRRSMELNTAKRYRNHTLVVDCATMIVNALKQSTSVNIPLLIDPSPSAVMMYLTTLKTLSIQNTQSHDLIGQTLIVAPESAERTKMHLIRNSYINILEGKILIYVYPFLAVHRGAIELIYGKENFQYWDPEVKDAVEDWQIHVKDNLRRGDKKLQIEFFEAQAVKINNNRNAKQQSKDLFKERLNDFVMLNIQNEKLVLQSAEASFWSLMKSNYRIEYFKQWQHHLNDSLDGSSEVFNYHVDFDQLISLSQSIY